MTKVYELLVVLGAVAAMFLTGCTSLHEASLAGDLEKVTSLIEDGDDVNEKDELGHTALFKAVIANNIEIVRYLVGHGADTEIVDHDGNTAILRAASDSYFEIVKYLSDNGADVNRKCRGGETTLYYAFKCGDLEAVKAVISAGADLNGLVPHADNTERIYAQVSLLYQQLFPSSETFIAGHTLSRAIWDWTVEYKRQDFLLEMIERANNELLAYENNYEPFYSRAYHSDYYLLADMERFCESSDQDIAQIKLFREELWSYLARLETSKKSTTRSLSDAKSSLTHANSSLFIEENEYENNYSKYTYSKNTTCTSCTGKGQHQCYGCRGAGSVVCSTCRKQGVVTCSTCSGKGSYRCDSCDYNGMVRHQYCGGYGSIRCDRCCGRGKEVMWNRAYDHNSKQYYNRKSFINCTKCNGYKVLRCCGSGKVKCGECRGSKSIFCQGCSGNGQHSCYTCSAKGFITCRSCYGNRTVRCSSCSGDGYNTETLHNDAGKRITRRIAQYERDVCIYRARVARVESSLSSTERKISFLNRVVAYYSASVEQRATIRDDQESGADETLISESTKTTETSDSDSDTRSVSDRYYSYHWYRRW